MKKFKLLVSAYLLSTVLFTSHATNIIDVNYNKEKQYPCLNLAQNLKYRSNDKNTKGEITKLQIFLGVNGYMVGIGVNGNFGNATLKAVKSFQKDNGIAITGIVGKITRKKISKITCDNTQTVSIIPNENIQVSKYKTIEEFLDTREKQSKYINMYIQVNENDFCGLEEKLPVRVYVILNNKSFEKKCFSKTFSFANGNTYDGVGTVFMYEGKIMLWEEFSKNLEREILISNEIPVFKIEKI